MPRAHRSILLGEGWRPDEAIVLDVNDDAGRTWELHDTVIADVAGGFRYEFRLADRFIATYTVVAVGALSGTAMWRFDDSIGTGPLTTGTNASGSSEITIATPASPSGRLLLATIVVAGLSSSDRVCAPSGWTSAGSTAVSGSIAVETFYRVTNGSEAASYTWRFRSAAIWCVINFLGSVPAGAVGGMTAYGGVDTSNPIASISGATGTGSSIAAPSVAGAPANATVVRAFGNSGTSVITPAASASGGIANTTAWSRVRSAGSLSPAGASADADQVTAGATGTLSASSSTSSTWAAQTIVLTMISNTPAVQLTIGDATAQFGANLTPTGVAAVSSDTVTRVVDGSVTSAGACYIWPGSVTVVATTAYDVSVSAAADNPRLDLLTATPTTYAACTGGEVVGAAMFPSAAPAGGWVTGQSATTGRTHSYWLGLDVRWVDDPSTTLGAATVTFQVTVDW